MFRNILITCVKCLIVSQSLLAADYTIIDTRSINYLDQLELTGLIGSLPHQQPWSSNVIAEMPDSIKQFMASRNLYLRQIFPFQPQAHLFTCLDGWLEMNGSGISCPGNFQGIALLGTGSWSMAASYLGRSGEEPEYGYYGYNWRGVRAKTDQIYLRWSGNNAFAQIGKDYLRYGLGMGLAGNRPFENIQGGVRLGQYLHLHCFTGKLDSWLREDVFVNRFLAGHRAQLTMGSIQLGISELAIYGGPGRTFEPYYFLPLYIFLGEQDNRQIDDNIIWCLDGKMTLPPFRLRAELMVDDIQIENKSLGDKEPSEVGVGARVDWAILSAPVLLSTAFEYRMITNWTFNQNKDWNRFLFEGQALGPIEGNDFDHSSWQIKAFGADWDARLEVYYKRKGQGRIEDDWTSPWTADSTWNERFPSGVIERTRGIQAELEYRPFGWKFAGADHQVSIFGKWRHQAISNSDNTEGTSDKRWLIALGLGLTKNISLNRFY